MSLNKFFASVFSSGAVVAPAAVTAYLAFSKGNTPVLDAEVKSPDNGLLGKKSEVNEPEEIKPTPKQEPEQPAPPAKPAPAEPSPSGTEPEPQTEDASEPPATEEPPKTPALEKPKSTIRFAGIETLFKSALENSLKIITNTVRVTSTQVKNMKNS